MMKSIVFLCIFLSMAAPAYAGAAMLRNMQRKTMLFIMLSLLRL